MTRCTCFVSLLVMFAVACNAQSPDLDVPYVPTPEPVVNRMLEMADVKKDDLVYDLGCGDGRIVITAVKEHGARGVGVDLDPERIADSNRNAEEASVTDRVTFKQANLFDVDFSEADVLAIYLLPSVNLELRPTILKMRPGTRVVSHAFDMGDWEPDATDEVQGSRIYFWVVPADVQGKWSWEADTPQGKQQVSVDLQQKYQELTGSAKVGDQEYEIAEAKLRGEQLSFTLKPGGQDNQATAMRYEGKVDGDKIRGEVKNGAAQAQPAGARDRETGAAHKPAAQNGAVEWVAQREKD